MYFTFLSAARAVVLFFLSARKNKRWVLGSLTFEQLLARQIFASMMSQMQCVWCGASRESKDQSRGTRRPETRAESGENEVARAAAECMLLPVCAVVLLTGVHKVWPELVAVVVILVLLIGVGVSVVMDLLQELNFILLHLFLGLVLSQRLRVRLSSPLLDR